MKCFTPQISWHNRDPILSVDIQNRVLTSNESQTWYRLATSGNDSHVIVWKASIENQMRTVANNKSSIVSLECLADLTRHQRSVNVVRFSPKPEDNFLAAGDDDCVIYIWKLSENKENNGIDITSPQKTTNGKDFCVKHKDNSDEDECQVIEENDSQPFVAKAHWLRADGQNLDTEVIAKENWTIHKILRGHLQDVSDICWSPDGQMILSGSVDNMAFVWDIHKGQKLIKIVNEHKGFVQGVAWDPVNKYLATLSADRNMRIINSITGRTVYRVHKTRLEEGKSTRLFYDDTLRSFCRRLAFTPGGEFLIAPSGIMELNDDIDSEDSNKYINTTYVFERKSLNKPSFYLPSKKYTIAVSCCPQLYQLQENLENHFQFPYRIVFAVATQDSVLFYDSQQTLPFAQVSQIHYLRLTDISWSPDGRMLIVSSTDGFATFITFDANEIGIPYDGPKFNFEEMETNSPINSTKNNLKVNVTVEATPESDKQIKKVSTPAITTFFKPSNELPNTGSGNDMTPIGSTSPTNYTKIITEPNVLSPESSASVVSNVPIMTPEMHKPIKKGSIRSFFLPKSETPNACNNIKDKIEEPSNGKKRKELVVDLTEDSEDTELLNQSSKRANFSRSPLKHANHVNQETAALSNLVGPPICKVKDHSVRKLVDQFEEVSMDESSRLSLDNVNEKNNEMKAKSLTETETETNVETSTSVSSQPIISSQPKQPRRIQFTTLGKK